MIIFSLCSKNVTYKHYFVNGLTQFLEKANASAKNVINICTIIPLQTKHFYYRLIPPILTTMLLFSCSEMLNNKLILKLKNAQSGKKMVIVMYLRLIFSSKSILQITYHYTYSILGLLEYNYKLALIVFPFNGCDCEPWNEISLIFCSTYTQWTIF